MNQKETFLKQEFIPLLRTLNSTDKGSWGVLNAQQMVEHFADSVMNASGKLKLPQFNEGERLEKMRAFMLSDTPFRENTKNQFMSEEGAPLRKKDMSSAIDKLQQELDIFFKTFDENPELETLNAFFGMLNREQNIHLLWKHAQHHLRQFGLEPRRGDIIVEQ